MNPKLQRLIPFGRNLAAIYGPFAVLLLVFRDKPDPWWFFLAFPAGPLWLMFHADFWPAAAQAVLATGAILLLLGLCWRFRSLGALAVFLLWSLICSLLLFALVREGISHA